MGMGSPAWSGTISSGGGAWRCCAARGTKAPGTGLARARRTPASSGLALAGAEGAAVWGAPTTPRQSRDGVMIPSSPGSVAGRRVRRALGAAAITAGLFLFALAAVPFFVDLDRYRDRWLPALASALRRRGGGG